MEITMRKVSHGHGFWLSYILNMAFRAEWLLLAVLLFAGYFVLKWKPLMWCALCALAVWFIYPLVITLLLTFASRMGNTPTPYRENKNPYSNGNNQNKGRNTMREEKLLCPCCRKYQLEAAGEYEICPICKWEDDPVQRKDPDFEGGANTMSLNQARRAFLEGNKK